MSTLRESLAPSGYSSPEAWSDGTTVDVSSPVHGVCHWDRARTSLAGNPYQRILRGRPVVAIRSPHNHESQETKPIASAPTSSQLGPVPTARPASVALRPRNHTSGRRFPTFQALASRRRATHFSSSIGQSTRLETPRQTSQSVKLSGEVPNAACKNGT